MQAKNIVGQTFGDVLVLLLEKKLRYQA